MAKNYNNKKAEISLRTDEHSSSCRNFLITINDNPFLYHYKKHFQITI